MPSLSKKQFFILAAIVIIITVIILVMISKGNANQVSSNNQDTEYSDNINCKDENNNYEDYLENSNDEQNDNTQYIPDDFQQTDNEEEVSIDTGAQDMNLMQIQKRVEVVTNNNSEQIFKDMISPTPAQIETYLGINLSNIDSYIVRIDKDKFSSKLYMIFKPTQEYKEEAKANIKKFLLAYEGAWSKLNEEQYNLVKDRTGIEKNGYIIYIISTDNDIIMNEIRNYI